MEALLGLYFLGATIFAVIFVVSDLTGVDKFTALVILWPFAVIKLGYKGLRDL